MSDEVKSRGNGRSVGRIVLIVAVAIAGVSVAYAMMRDRPAGDSPAPTAAMDGAQAPQMTLEQLQNRVGANPKDAEGWQLLAWAYFDMQKYSDAARAYRRAVKLRPENAVYWSSLGEALVMASEKDPMPAEAVEAFEKSLAIDPKDPRARYFLAVKRDLTGDHEGAISDWLTLLKETPPGAPWEEDLRRTVTQVGKINNIEVETRLAAIRPAAPHPAMGGTMPGGSMASVATSGIPGPTREDMEAASKLSPGEQSSMVDGMVASLEGKLKDNPKNVDGWIMLMRSRMTLGQPAKASMALQQALAANPTQAGRLKDEARVLGVPGGA